MTIFFLILGAGLLGIVGHWLTRYTQGRTESTFMEYMKQYKANSISSIFSVIASNSTIYASLPEDIHGKPLMMVILGSYTAAYMLDSTVNKDARPLFEPVIVKALRKADAKKSLNDIVSDDASL